MTSANFPDRYFSIRKNAEVLYEMPDRLGDYFTGKFKGVVLQTIVPHFIKKSPLCRLLRIYRQATSNQRNRMNAIGETW